MLIKDKITSQLKKRFLEEIKKTKETNKERGFHLCIEENGKLSAGDTCIGEECALKFQHVSLSCPEKKVQGDFHTHPYLAEVKKQFGITFKASDELIRSASGKYLEERGVTSTIPSQGDIISAILGKCSKRTEGTTCVGSDLDESKIECWNIKEVDNADCFRALLEHLSPKEEEESKLPKDWAKPLFEVEMINLKKRG
jgi:hypothetical protein